MKKISLTILFIIFFLTFTCFIISSNNSYIYYSKETNNFIKNKELNYIYQEKYSQTLDMLVKTNNLNEKYINEYLKINYIEKDNFLKHINSYLELGYNGEEINNIFKLSKKNQDKILNNKKINNIQEYINIKNFDIDKIDRYTNYAKNNKDNLQNIITYVNLNLDQEFYTEPAKITDPNNLNTLINKYNYIDQDYIPNDLVNLFDNKNTKMVRDASNAYKKLIEAANKDNITLKSTTAYRSYNYQKTLYDNYVLKDGIIKADTYSARPGYSEHQLGLAVDLTDLSVKDGRINDLDYEWLINNSYKYGFIIRYPKGKENITGYIYEPWHLRYLGIELATNVYNSDLTYDEYYDLYMSEH